MSSRNRNVAIVVGKRIRLEDPDPRTRAVVEGEVETYDTHFELVTIQGLPLIEEFYVGDGGWRASAPREDS